MRSAIPILLLVAGCTLSVEETKTFSGDIDRIELALSKGDVQVEARRGDITLDIDFGGLGSGDVGTEVIDGTLYIDYDCGGPELCGGDLALTAPAGTELDLALGAGDMSVEDMRGDVVAALGAGSASVERHGAATVVVDTAAGDIAVTFDKRPVGVDLLVATGSIDLTVPAGTYALDIQAKAGSVSIDGIDEDPGNAVLLAAQAGTGSISVQGR